MIGPDVLLDVANGVMLQAETMVQSSISRGKICLHCSLLRTVLLKLLMARGPLVLDK